MHVSSGLAILAAAPAAFAVTNAPRFADRYTFNAPYSQDFSEGYSILKHIGSLGPYANHASFGVGRDPPDGCKVDQVVMLRRHGERYPQSSELKTFNTTLHKIRTSGVKQFHDDLYFLNKWEWKVPDSIYALETESGPYNGLLTTYKHGAEYRVRYGHLFDPHNKKKVPMWTSQYERVIQTARKFGEGFFGWNYTTSAALNVIPEGYSQGANTLTPKCAANKDYGQLCQGIKNERAIYNVAADRINKQNPGLDLNATDIYHLMSYSIYELNYQGWSDWTNVFTLDEWVNFGYNEDLGFYYCVGPGNKYSLSRGSVFANASLTLLNDGPEKSGSLFFTFAHDSNITPVLYALGIRVPDKDMPLDGRVPFPNPYKIGDIMPMGGHLVLERLQCDATANSKKDTYVRVVLNEAVIPYNDCQEGPGYSCSLKNYTKLIQHRLKDVNYIKDCKVNSTVPQYVDFFWNYNTSSALNHQSATYIPYQGLQPV